MKTNMIYGAPAGDSCGSTLEVVEIKALKNKTKITYKERKNRMEEPLFRPGSSYTDDTTLTCAVAEALLDGSDDYEYYLRKHGMREKSLGMDVFGRNRFGSGFNNWLDQSKQGTSYSSGAPMRCSPIAYYFDDLDTIIEHTIKATIPSHNHPVAIKGACAVNTAIYYAKNNTPKEKIKEIIENEYDYNLNFDLEELRKNYTFKKSCDDIVPQSIFAFLCGEDYEQVIRTAYSIGGDVDTTGAIAGSIASAYYGIPDWIVEETKKLIPEYMVEICDQFNKTIEKRNNNARKLNKTN